MNKIEKSKLGLIFKPRPLVLITTQNAKGKINAAPYSFIGPVSVDPPLLSVSMKKPQQTYQNIILNHKFVVNFVSKKILEQCVACEQKFPGKNKLDAVGSEIIDFENKNIKKLCQKLLKNSQNKIDYIKNAFEFIRDNIKHSADADLPEITLKASDVLVKGHGICYAKSHLLAAILRVNEIPAGLCYQKLVLIDEEPNNLCLHGLMSFFLL